MVLELFPSSITNFVKVHLREDKAVIDNVVFRLHYRLTAGILFAFCILCAANTLIGDPIDCIHDDTFKNNKKIVDMYCWITSTYTLPHLQDEKPMEGGQVVAPGVGNHKRGVHPEKHHTYYQWVPFMLLLQGLMFYLPHWLWKSWEDGKIRKISDGLRGALVGISDDTKEAQQNLAKYIVDTLHYHNVYAICYFFCDYLNFINVVGNIFFVDVFLGGTFLTYGTKVIEFSGMEQANRTDPMIVTFPRVTKCDARTYGPSGDVQHHDILCVLPVNILNEKIYIFLWFWFIILSVITGLRIIYSAVVIFYPPVRKLVIEKRFNFKAPPSVSPILEKMQIGDFLVLQLLGRNMCVAMYRKVIEEVSEQLHDYKPHF